MKHAKKKKKKKVILYALSTIGRHQLSGPPPKQPNGCILHLAIVGFHCRLKQSSSLSAGLRMQRRTGHCDAVSKARGVAMEGCRTVCSNL
jgi:hypothetical protein